MNAREKAAKAKIAQLRNGASGTDGVVVNRRGGSHIDNQDMDSPIKDGPLRRLLNLPPKRK